MSAETSCFAIDGRGCLSPTFSSPMFHNPYSKETVTTTNTASHATSSGPVQPIQTGSIICTETSSVCFCYKGECIYVGPETLVNSTVKSSVQSTLVRSTIMTHIATTDIITTSTAPPKPEATHDNKLESSKTPRTLLISIPMSIGTAFLIICILMVWRRYHRKSFSRFWSHILCWPRRASKKQVLTGDGRSRFRKRAAGVWENKRNSVQEQLISVGSDKLDIVEVGYGGDAKIERSSIDVSSVAGTEVEEKTWEKYWSKTLLDKDGGGLLAVGKKAGSGSGKECCDSMTSVESVSTGILSWDEKV